MLKRNSIISFLKLSTKQISFRLMSHQASTILSSETVVERQNGKRGLESGFGSGQCDKSVNKERGTGTENEEPERGTRNRNGERGTGTGNEEPERGTRNRNGERGTGMGNEELERGTRLWNEARETLRPFPNSVTARGNEDPPCVYMGERVTLFLDV